MKLLETEELLSQKQSDAHGAEPCFESLVSSIETTSRPSRLGRSDQPYPSPGIWEIEALASDESSSRAWVTYDNGIPRSRKIEDSVPRKTSESFLFSFQQKSRLCCNHYHVICLNFRLGSVSDSTPDLKVEMTLLLRIHRRPGRNKLGIFPQPRLHYGVSNNGWSLGKKGHIDRVTLCLNSFALPFDKITSSNRSLPDLV